MIWLLLVIFTVITVLASLLIPIVFRAHCKMPVINTEDKIVNASASNIDHISIVAPGVIQVGPSVLSVYNNAHRKNIHEIDNNILAANMTDRYVYRVKRSSVLRAGVWDFNSTILLNGTGVQINVVDKTSRLFSCKHFEAKLFVPVQFAKDTVSLHITSIKDNTDKPSIIIEEGVVFASIDTNSLHGNTFVTLNANSYPGAKIQMITESGTFFITENGKIQISNRTRNQIEATVVGNPSTTAPPQSIILRSTSGNIKVSAE